MTTDENSGPPEAAAAATEAPAPVAAAPAESEPADIEQTAELAEAIETGVKALVDQPGEAEIQGVEFGAAVGDATGSPEDMSFLFDVSLKVTVQLGGTSRTIRDILGWGPGSVIELEKLAGEPVDILVNNTPIATGEVVVVDESFGVRITDVLSPRGRLESIS